MNSILRQPLCLACVLLGAIGCGANAINWPTDEQLNMASIEATQNSFADKESSTSSPEDYWNKFLLQWKTYGVRPLAKKLFDNILNNAKPHLLIEINDSEMTSYKAILYTEHEHGGWAHWITFNWESTYSDDTAVVMKGIYLPEPHWKLLKSMWNYSELVSKTNTPHPLNDNNYITFWDDDKPRTFAHSSLDYMPGNPAFSSIDYVCGRYVPQEKLSLKQLEFYVAIHNAHYQTKYKQWKEAHQNLQRALALYYKVDHYFEYGYFGMTESEEIREAMLSMRPKLKGEGAAEIELVKIPAGEFMMGDNENLESEDAMPRHLVKITKPFYMSKFEITQEQFEKVMGYNSNEIELMKYRHINPKYPATFVSWNDAVEFCRRQSVYTGKTVRLPTEAEWEYATRAGTTTKTYLGDSVLTSKNANFTPPADEDSGAPKVVGSYPPNQFGLYDCYGNVMEWCSDWHDYEYYAKSPVENPTGPAKAGEYNERVIRGGSWVAHAHKLCSGMRASDSPNMHSEYIGFRVVVEVEE